MINFPDSILNSDLGAFACFISFIFGVEGISKGFMKWYSGGSSTFL